MPKTPLISVVMACFNGASTLEKTLSSVADQSFRDFEVLLIDDGSRDETAVLAEELMKKLDLSGSLIRLPENRGISFARNTGIEQARGTYINYFDQDDFMEPEFLGTAVSALEESGGDFWGCGYTVKDPSGRTLQTRRPRDIQGVSKALNYMRGILKFHLIGTLYRLSFIKREGLYFPPESRYALDQEYIVRALSRSAAAVINPAPLVSYLQHPEQTSNTARMRDIFEDGLSVFGRLLSDPAVAADEDLCRWIRRVEIPRIHLDLLKKCARTGDREAFFENLTIPEFRKALKSMLPLHRRAIEDFLKSRAALVIPSVFYRKYAPKD